MTETAGAAQRGMVLLDLGRAAEAEQHFREALASDPTNADLLVFLAQALNDQERHAEARDAAQQALASAPEHVGGLIILSAALAGLHDFKRALEANRRGLQLAPEFAGLHRQQGVLLLAQNQAWEALVPLEKARSLDPENSMTMAFIAAALFDERRFEEAERAVAEALELDADNPEAHRVRGLLALRRGGGEGAVDAYRTALRLDPSDARYREDLALAMKSRNRLYGLLLRWSDWMAGLPGAFRWLVLLSPFFASRILRPFADPPLGLVLFGVLAAFILITWAIEPVMNTVLLCSTYARNLLPRATKVATCAFLAYVGTAVAAVILGTTLPSGEAMWLGFGLGVWALSAGRAHEPRGRLRRVSFGLQCAGALLAVATAAAVALGLSAAGPLALALFLSGLAMTWFTALA